MNLIKYFTKINILPSKLLLSLEKKKNDYIKKKKVIWHITTPRCGSTSLMEYFRDEFKNVGYGPFQTFPYQENRFQNICSQRVFNTIFFRKEKFFFSTHSHTLATNDFLNLISSNHLVILQYRSIEETLNSLFFYLKDGVYKNPKLIHKGLNFWLPFGFNSNSDEEKFLELIYSYVPWHINFLKGWILESNSSFEKIFINLNEINKNFPNVKKKLNKIFENKFDISLSENNLNKFNENPRNYKSLINNKHREVINEIKNSMLKVEEIEKIKLHDEHLI